MALSKNPSVSPEIPCVEAAGNDSVDILDFVSENMVEIQEALNEAGSVLLRGCGARTHESLDGLPELFGGEPLDYKDAATPRSSVSGGVYTSTDYPASERIELHNEGCYSDSWPGYLYFACQTAAAGGGGTTVADGRRLLGALEKSAPELIERLREGVTYVRTFHPRLGIAWQDSFGTEDRDEVVASCERRGLRAHWIGEDVLQTKATWPALTHHPETGEECWFNQVVAFHPAALPVDLRKVLTRTCGQDMLPKTVTYADDSPIPDDVVEHVLGEAHKITIPAPWRVGDVMIVDNILSSHGREPYTGERRVLVSMSHERCWDAVASGVGHGN
ncbi:TauD/TfdA family dioxygenase [Nocardiopsis sp. JB363]|uniref:TauD/TfdA family dioxygenase n=1 Tax=Nocardiopsis sp. JB363 TaxID=1434837 RepID=UPI00097AF62C|nr:TauD/TfdA family dioxygenase [Nocardiopsis sp. JB363]SIO90374.1 SyrP-like protein [Nocardiopsis sp. JB363]